MLRLDLCGSPSTVGVKLTNTLSSETESLGELTILLKQGVSFYGYLLKVIVDFVHVVATQTSAELNGTKRFKNGL